MRWKTQTAVILFVCLLLAGGLAIPCGAEDYAANNGIALYRVELQNLAQQIVKLKPAEEDQREFLDRLFQMKFGEAERMFSVCGDGKQVKRLIAELYVLKAVVADAMGNWIQSYASVQDAAGWSRDALTQPLKLGGKEVDVVAFSEALKAKVQARGNQVRFVIKPFPSDRMFHPDKVVLSRSEDEATETRSVGTSNRTRARQDRGSQDERWKTTEEPREKIEVSQQDQAYVVDRLNKALYAYYYDPIEKNAQFDLFLPCGGYYLYEKDFTVHPVEFEVSDRNTQVVLRPARWFRMTVSEEVHPSNVHLSFHGVEWKDLDHVPFGRYRVHVKSNQFTGPAVRVTFVPKMDTASEEEAAGRKGKVVVVEDRGVYKLSLHQRTGNEKLRYSLLGF